MSILKAVNYILVTLAMMGTWFGLLLPTFPNAILLLGIVSAILMRVIMQFAAYLEEKNGQSK